MAKSTDALSRDRAPRVTRLDLRKTRQNKGVSLEAIAEATKISIRFLRAIEDEEFEQLPGGIFTTSYLRQYAAAIGFEESTLVGYYQRRCEGLEEPEISGDLNGRGSLLRWWRTSSGPAR